MILFGAVIRGQAKAQTIPSSELSRKVVQQESLGLKKAYSKAGLKWSSAIYMRIFKKEKTLEIWVLAEKNYRLFKTYKICTFGSGSLGPKTEKGDGHAPEGFYFVKAEQLNPWSDYYLSFNIGYPNRYDRGQGLSLIHI